MTPYERAYLEDTITILMHYDGETTVKGLKGLIDETSDRIKDVLDGKIQTREDVYVTQDEEL